VADVDGDRSTTTDGVRIGSTRILTLGPDGTATSGTLYVRGRRGQFAVRILSDRSNESYALQSGERSMDSTLTERRSEPRQPAKALDIERATLRPGCLVAVLDVSANGAQVQSGRCGRAAAFTCGCVGLGFAVCAWLPTAIA
jgi:hypothetical protein